MGMCTTRSWWAPSLIAWLLISPTAAQTGPGQIVYTAPQVVAGRALGFDFVTTITLQNRSFRPCSAEVLLHRGPGPAVGVDLLVNGEPLVNPLNFTLAPLAARRLRITAAPDETEVFQGAARIRDFCHSLTVAAGFDVVADRGTAVSPLAASAVPNEIFNYRPDSVVALSPGSNARTLVDFDPRGDLDGFPNIPGAAVVGDPFAAPPAGTELCHQVFSDDLLALTGVRCDPFNGLHLTFNLNDLFPELQPQNDVLWEMFLQGTDSTDTRWNPDLLVIDVTTPNQFRPAPVDIVNPDCFTTGLCLNNGRFFVEVAGFDGTVRSDALPDPIDETSGLFFFADFDNGFDVLVNLLDGCGFNDHFWVFAAAATSVEVQITVTDTLTNEVQTYTNPFGTPFAPVADTRAFATCP